MRTQEPIGRVTVGFHFGFGLCIYNGLQTLKRLVNIYRNPFSPWSDKQINKPARTQFWYDSQLRLH